MPKLTGQELKAAERKVRSLLEDIAEEVAAIPAAHLRRFLPILQAAEKEAERALEDWLATAPGGSERFTAHHRRQVLLQLRKARSLVQGRVMPVPPWIGSIREGLNDALRGGLRGSGVLATKNLQKEIAALDQIFESGLAPLPLKQAAIIAHGEKMLIRRFESSARRYSGAIWDDLRRQLSIGVARNQSINEMVDRLVKMGGPPGPGAPFGMFRKYRFWGERVVRTELIHAYNLQHTEGLRQVKELDSSMTQRWDSSLDSRLCEICYGLHGEIVEIGESFPGGYEHPPAHPNCRCAVVAWHDSWDLPKRDLEIVPRDTLTEGTQENTNGTR